MRTEVIYSIAALATFPVVANAQVDAASIATINIEDGESSTKIKDADGDFLVKGKYTITSDAITGTADNKITVKVKNGNEELNLNGGTDQTSVEVTVGSKINIAFELTEVSQDGITLEIESEDVTEVKNVKVALNYDFTSVAGILNNKFNTDYKINVWEKVEVRKTTEDNNLQEELDKRIKAIANGDYKFYKENVTTGEELGNVIGKESQRAEVLTLPLSTAIDGAITSLCQSELNYQTGDDVLGKLNGRYDALQKDGEENIDPNAVDYQELVNDAKEEVDDKVTEIGESPNASNLEKLRSKIAAYSEKLTEAESTKTANESAYKDLQEKWQTVYNGSDTDETWYAQIYKYLDEYTSDERSGELATESKNALTEKNTANNTEFEGLISTARRAIKAADEKTELETYINRFKQDLTDIKSQFDTDKAKLESAYKDYDESLAAFEEATENVDNDSPNALKEAKSAWKDAVDNLKTYIKGNDIHDQISDLSGDDYTAKITAITTAKNNFESKAGEYEEYFNLLTEAGDQSTALTEAVGAIDAYAVEQELLDEEEANPTYKPSVIWNTTVSDISGKIDALKGTINGGIDTDGSFKKPETYADDLKKIQAAIEALESNAKKATDIYKTISDNITTATELRVALQNPGLDPKVDLTTLSVWTTKITIDEEAQKRTPYKDYIGTNDEQDKGSIGTNISTWNEVLTEAVGKTGILPTEENADKTGNILGYLENKVKDLENGASDVLQADIAILNGIKANYNTDESLYTAQMDANDAYATYLTIGVYVDRLQQKIDYLQGVVDNNGDDKKPTERTVGNKGKETIEGKISDYTEKKKQVQEEAEANKTNKAKLNELNTNIQKWNEELNTFNTTVSTTDEKNLPDIESDYANFKRQYEALYGEETPSENTLKDLNNKLEEANGVIDGYENLTDNQKVTLKEKVAGVEYKPDGVANAETYTIESVTEFIDNAFVNEELTDEQVNSYKEVIGKLKEKIDDVTEQADKLNDLEEMLADLNEAIETATVNVAKEGAGDPTKGFYYNLLTGNKEEGQYTYDYNKLKESIEQDSDITDEEYSYERTYSGTYYNQILNLITKVHGVARKAKENLEAYNDAKNLYEEGELSIPYGDETYNGVEAWYEALVAELNNHPSSELEAKKAEIAVIKDKLDELYNTKNPESYAKGSSVADNIKGKINDEIINIRNEYAAYVNPVNYSSTVTADNLAKKEAAEAAGVEAKEAYATAAQVINSYNNLKSAELKHAAEQAESEKESLLDVLEGFSKTWTDNDNALQDEYRKTISPDVFDKDEKYKKAFEELRDEVIEKTEALTSKINEKTATEVANSVDGYDQAISESKEKVQNTFFNEEADKLKDNDIKSLYADADNLLANIKKYQNDLTQLKSLDDALVAAEKEGTGINDRIKEIEKNRATVALKAIHGNDGAAYDVENTRYDEIYFAIYDKKVDGTTEATPDEKAENAENRVKNFSDYKSDLNQILEQYKNDEAIQAAIADATAAIAAAQTAVDAIGYDGYAAGTQVKEAIDDINEVLATEVTAENAKDLKDSAKDIEDNLVPGIYEDLYDAEVDFLNKQIRELTRSLLTYQGEEVTQGDIDNQQNALTDVTDAVANEEKTKQSALEDLKRIENALNGIFKTIDEAGSNLNDTFKENVEKDLQAQKDRLDGIVDENGDIITGNEKLTAEKESINGNIDNLTDYIEDHEDEFYAYKDNAIDKLEDIKTAITNFEANVKKNSAEAIAAQKAAIDAIWAEAEEKISDTNSLYEDLIEQLEAYGNKDNYSNKLEQLEGKIQEATETLNKRKALDITDLDLQKQNAEEVRDEAIPDILDGVESDIDEIKAMAKSAYIEDAETEVREKLLASGLVTIDDNGNLVGKWSSSDNYTNGDKEKLDQALNDLVVDFDEETDEIDHAKDVITTVNEEKEKFNEGLEALKALEKELRLNNAEETSKGHLVTDNDEPISPDDFAALVDLIINDKEADMETADINEDGELDITDISWLRYYLVHGDWPNSNDTANRPRAARSLSNGNGDKVELQVVSAANNITRVAFNLTNETVFDNFQFDIVLPEGAKVVGKSLGERVEGANLLMGQNENRVRLIGISYGGKVISGENGAVVYLDIENLNGDLTTEKAIFTDSNLVGRNLLDGSETTGIRQKITNLIESAGERIYDLGGKISNGIKNGIKIIKKGDGTTKKVVSNK